MPASDKTNPTDHPGLGAMIDANPMAKAWMAMMSESIRFVTERLRHDIELQQAMLACKYPADLMQLQSEFYAKAMAQYTQETVKILEMMSQAATSSAENITLGTKRRYDDVPI